MRLLIVVIVHDLRTSPSMIYNLGSSCSATLNVGIGFGRLTLRIQRSRAVDPLLVTGILLTTISKHNQRTCSLSQCRSPNLSSRNFSQAKPIVSKHPLLKELPKPRVRCHQIPLFSKPKANCLFHLHRGSTAS